MDDDASSDDVRSLSDDDSSGSGLSLDDDPPSDELITDEDEEDYEGEEGEDDTDADLQDFIEHEQHELLNCLKDPSDRDVCPEDKSVIKPKFNLDESIGQ